MFPSFQLLHRIWHRSRAVGVIAILAIATAPAAAISFEAVILGSEEQRIAGYTVDIVGDLDSDGYADWVIGAPYETIQSSPRGRGAAYLFYGGNPKTLFGTVDLSSADAKFEGNRYTQFAGFDVTGAGDLNGDGVDDLVLGALQADYVLPGQPWGSTAYGRSAALFYGGERLSGTYISDWVGPDYGRPGADAVFQSASSFAGTARAVAGRGDFDGDGLDDLLIGSPFADPLGRNGAGEARIVYGRSGSEALAGYIRLDGLSRSVTLQGVNPKDRAGYSLAMAGDVNGDGSDDVLVGAYLADPEGVQRAGEAYLIYGRSGDNALEGELDLANADVTFVGQSANAWAGYAVSPAGDFNGDGLDDLLITAPQSVGQPGLSDEKKHSGKAYLFFGRDGAEPFSDRVNLSDADVTLTGDRFDRLGMSADAAGDLNGDGFDDVVLGAFPLNGNEDGGYAEVVFGGVVGPFVPQRLTEMGWLRTSGEIGLDVSGGGDVNGDGLDDLLVGVPQSREVFLLGGEPTSFARGVPEPGTLALLLLATVAAASLRQ